MQDTFFHILKGLGFSIADASTCAEVFTNNSIDGVYTHGVNRFPRFVEYIKKGFVKPSAKATPAHVFGSIEQWDGNLAPGIISALSATNRAMQLASDNGLGCVTLRNTNHWMRGGTYGWKAAKAGFVFIGWTNTIANMPAWGAVDPRLGNNPLVIAIPFQDEAIVLDMAMSQFSFGTLEKAGMQNESLSVNGGFDEDGKLTSDPKKILASGRPLPVGYWKGAGLSLLLDILATILSGGNSTADISREAVEFGLSQVFVAIDLSKFDNASSIPAAVRHIVEDYHLSVPAQGNSSVLYPGERVLQARKKNLAEGIPVMKKVWEEITLLDSSV